MKRIKFTWTSYLDEDTWRLIEQLRACGYSIGALLAIGARHAADDECLDRATEVTS